MPGSGGGTAQAPHVLVAGSVSSLARIAAQHVVDTLAFRLKDEWVSAAHLVVSGGPACESVIESLADAASRRVDWAKVHVWWSAERYLPDGSIGRYETRARAAGIARLGVLPEHLHPIPAPEHPRDEMPDRAATAYARTLRKYAPHGRVTPVFDLALLELAPDGSVAALFPDGWAVDAPEVVVPVWNAPPPSRLCVTMTPAALGAAARVWVFGAGSDRAEVVRRLWSADGAQLPAARTPGIIETLWWLDQKAAAAIPHAPATAVGEETPARDETPAG